MSYPLVSALEQNVASLHQILDYNCFPLTFNLGIVQTSLKLYSKTVRKIYLLYFEAYRYGNIYQIAIRFSVDIHGSKRMFYDDFSSGSNFWTKRSYSCSTEDQPFLFWTFLLQCHHCTLGMEYLWMKFAEDIHDPQGTKPYILDMVIKMFRK